MRSFAGFEEENYIAAAELKTTKLVALVDGVRCRVYGVGYRPPDGRYLLDTNGHDSYLAVRARIYNKDSTRLQHLEICHAALLIPIPGLRFVPYNDTTSGMDTRNSLTLQHRPIAGRMETMIVKDIEDDMHRLATGKRIPIGAVAEQIQPVSDTRGLDRRESDLAVARARERMNE